MLQAGNMGLSCVMACCSTLGPEPLSVSFWIIDPLWFYFVDAQRETRVYIYIFFPFVLWWLKIPARKMENEMSPN